MGTVRSIPPKFNIPPKLKVAAYCRVSTKKAEQLSSLTMQERYYEKRIRQNPDWIFARVYSDIGSGTRIKGRSRFKALLSACRRGKVDMILIKSAHRFARNTVDALKTIRMLRSRNIDIYFERENIHTLYESSEFMLMLVCALAQDESYSKSEDIKWGLRKSFQNPDSKYYQRICYGYTHDQQGKLIIHKEQAETVRLIYEMSASGASLARISAYLEDMGIPSPRGKEVWSKETLRKILSNEKYKGSVTLQKTFVENYLEHKQIKNIGQLDIYQIDYNHKPILYVDLSYYNCDFDSDSLTEIQSELKKIRAEIRILQNENDSEKISNLSADITQLYQITSKVSELASYDFRKAGFHISYLKNGNIIQPQILEGEDDGIKQNVNYYTGSMARHTLIQLCGYLGFLRMLIKEHKYPLIPFLVIDHISKTFDSRNRKALGAVLHQVYKDFSKSELQIILFDDKDASDLGITPDFNTNLLDKGKSGFNPFYTPPKEELADNTLNE